MGDAEAAKPMAEAAEAIKLGGEAPKGEASLEVAPAAGAAEGVTLSGFFYQAYGDYKRKKREITEIREDFLKLAHLVERAHIFSSNEELEDVNTCDLKFALVPFVLGDLCTQITDMKFRKEALQDALVFMKRYMEQCRQWGVADPEELAAWDRDHELSGEARRNEKVARFRAGKDLDQKIEFLFSRKNAAGSEEFNWGNAGALDEETERELVVSLLKRGVVKCLEERPLLEEELPLLEKFMAGEKPAPNPPAKPWTMSFKSRDELMEYYRERVFQPGHVLPTMSLADFAEGEYQEMLERTAREKKSEAKQAAEKAAFEDEDNMEYDDARAKKAQDWDDWKDANPKGSGNKMKNVG